MNMWPKNPLSDLVILVLMRQIFHHCHYHVLSVIGQDFDTYILITGGGGGRVSRSSGEKQINLPDMLLLLHQVVLLV